MDDRSRKAAFSQKEQTTPLRLMPSTIIAGKYELLSSIGQGGMGSLFMAKHIQLGKYVAIKVQSTGAAQGDAERERFEREARLAASLTHTNLVGVNDYGELEDGSSFMVMDLLSGKSLAEILTESGPICEERAVPIFLQICSGLSHAHENGLLHRDLKPGNIMIVEENGTDLAKIVDFGLAKSTLEGVDAKTLTQTGEIFGSPLYMSPEQCLGSTLDVRSDIYSMACLMYEVLSGLRPIEGQTALATLARKLKVEPQPVLERMPQLKLDPRLDAIILKCLRRDPNQRCQSVDELRAALSALLSNPASTRAPSTIPASSKSALNAVFAESALNRGRSPTASEDQSECHLSSGKVYVRLLKWLSGLILVGVLLCAFMLMSQQGPQKDTGDPNYPLQRIEYPAKPGVEVQIVGVSNGEILDKGAGERLREATGRVRVRVTSKHKELVLVLAGWGTTDWELFLDPGIKVKQLILTGMYKQSVKGLPDGVPTVTSFSDSKEAPFEYFVFPDRCADDNPVKNYDGLPRFIKDIEKLTGGSVKTIRYRSEAYDIVVD